MAKTPSKGDPTKRAETQPNMDYTTESFDTILGQLQHIVEQLENEDLTLEDSLKAFEQGIMLSQKGQKILDTAEKRVDLLLQNGSTEPLEAS